MGRSAVAVAVTVTVDLALIAPETAVTVNGPPATAGAVYSPELEIDPLPVRDHVIALCEIAFPNWSTTVAVNCCVPLTATVADTGLSFIPAAVCCTLTLTADVAVSPPASVTRTRNV